MNVDSEMPLAMFAKIIDISKSGVLIKTDRKLDIGKNYALKIEYGNKVVVVKAEVIWSSMDDHVEQSTGIFPSLCIAGMQFTDVLKGEITAIMKSIEFDNIILSYLEKPYKQVSEGTF